MAIPLTSMRSTLRGTSFDTFITDDPDFGWAVHYGRGTEDGTYKIAKVEPWVAYAHGEADPDCRYKKVMRIGNAQDELDAYTQAMRILKDLPE